METTTDVMNFNRRVVGYMNDNRQYVEDQTAQGYLDHWDTNGPEGIGEPLTDEERRQFLHVAESALRDGFYPHAGVFDLDVAACSPAAHLLAAAEQG